MMSAFVIWQSGIILFSKDCTKSLVLGHSIMSWIDQAFLESYYTLILFLVSFLSILLIRPCATLFLPSEKISLSILHGLYHQLYVREMGLESAITSHLVFLLYIVQ